MMFPYIFKIGSFELRPYSLAIMLGIILALYFIIKKSKSMGIESKKTENLVLGIFFSGILGARIYYVIFNWSYFNVHRGDILATWKGGLAIHGGIIAGSIAGFILCRLYKLNFFKTADICAPFVLLGQGIGRFGNFANGEAHGFPTITPPDIIFRLKPVFNEFWSQVLRIEKISKDPEGMNELYRRVLESPRKVIFDGREYVLKEYFPWGVSFPEKYKSIAYSEFGSLPVHPTFFYEMILNFIGAGILYLIWRNNKNIGKGLIFGLYLIFYGTIRAFITFFRADDLMVGYLRAPHLVSIFMVVIGAIWIILGERSYGKY